jgi:hypothetical protein
VAEEPDYVRQQQLLTAVYKMRLASRESIIDAGLFPTLAALLRKHGVPAVPPQLPRLSCADDLDRRRLELSSVVVRRLLLPCERRRGAAAQHACARGGSCREVQVHVLVRRGSPRCLRCQRFGRRR